MSGFLLDTYPASSTIYALFHTFNSSGASSAVSNIAVGDILIYKNGSTTQRSSTSGFALLDTDGIDFDGTTGIGGVSIDLSDNTDASFYAVGSQYTVVLGPVTVDSQTVNFVLGAFRIVAAESVAGKPKVDTDTFGGSAGTFSSGIPEVNTTKIAGSAVSASSAQIGVNVVNIAGAAVSTTTAQIGANIVKVNDTTVTGAGTSGDPWGP